MFEKICAIDADRGDCFEGDGRKVLEDCGAALEAITTKMGCGSVAQGMVAYGLGW